MLTEYGMLLYKEYVVGSIEETYTFNYINQLEIDC